MTMNLPRRIARLESRMKPPIEGPAVIFICDGFSGEAMAAMQIGGGNITRGPGETEDEFEARARAGATAVYLPDNGRGDGPHDI